MGDHVRPPAGQPATMLLRLSWSKTPGLGAGESRSGTGVRAPDGPTVTWSNPTQYIRTWHEVFCAFPSFLRRGTGVRAPDGLTVTWSNPTRFISTAFFSLLPPFFENRGESPAGVTCRGGDQVSGRRSDSRSPGHTPHYSQRPIIGLFCIFCLKINAVGGSHRAHLVKPHMMIQKNI